MKTELRECPFCGERTFVKFTPLEGCTDIGNITCVCGFVYTTISQGLDDWNHRPIEDDLRNRIAELEAESERFTVHSDIEWQDDKWIPVSERLPEVYRDEDGEFIPFLVCEGDGDRPFIAMYNGINWWAGIFVPDITHWMPLPELPIVYGKEREQ